MSRATHRHEGGPRAKRGLPRPCKACGQDFRPKNSKAKYCSSACKQAQHRQKPQEPQIVTAATTVARVTIRAKSPNNINGVSGHFAKPRVTAKTGWQIEAGELVFYPMPGTQPLTESERRCLCRGHMMLKPVSEGRGAPQAAIGREAA